jgi:AAA15 family ATPase/GTPase
MGKEIFFNNTIDVTFISPEKELAAQISKLAADIKKIEEMGEEKMKDKISKLANEKRKKAEDSYSLIQDYASRTSTSSYSSTASLNSNDNTKIGPSNTDNVLSATNSLFLLLGL